MFIRRFPRRSRERQGRTVGRTLAGLTLLLLAAALIFGGTVLRSMVTEYAASAARDTVVSAVNGIVKSVMADPAYTGQALVDLERDANGDVTAVTTDVVAVNSLAAEVLSRAIAQTEQDVLTVKIPVANLFGSALLMNRGPSISVDVTMLSSSTAGYRSEITSAGINQTRHQLFLDLDVQLSFLMPWRGMETSVQTEILVSETVIVGQVPGSYMNWER